MSMHQLSGKETGMETGMELDFGSQRAKRLIREHSLTDEEIQQIVASARINLTTFDPEYRTNITEIADDLQKSRPTIYGWADRAIAATIHSLRNIRTGRPPIKAARATALRAAVDVARTILLDNDIGAALLTLLRAVDADDAALGHQQEGA